MSVDPPSALDVISFLRDNRAPCPRCTYQLHGLDRPQCPECGEPLVLTVGSPKAHFAWLLVAAAPGCFSFVAALFVAVPVVGNLIFSPHNMPWPIVAADAFGFLSGASVILMYRKRQWLLRHSAAMQAMFAGGVWAVHVLIFLIVLGAMYLVTSGARTPAAAPTPAPTPSAQPAPDQLPPA